VAFDVVRTLEKVRALAADAKKRGVRLIVFPEAFVSAYPRGLAFGATVGARTQEGRKQFRTYWEGAIDVPGPHVDVLADVARINQSHLVIGVVERSSGTLYCTVLFFGADGSYRGKHRKLMPTASERLVWGRRRFWAPGELVRRQDKTATLERDVLHRRQPGIAAIRGDAACNRHGRWARGRCHLLGELHAVASSGDVRERHRNFLRS
jgi:predicted amidohydrolase